MRKKRQRMEGYVHRMSGMKIPKRLVKVEIEGRRKLLDKEKNGYRK
jgi:hypothetical protein